MGKTAVAEGLARRIAEGSVPPPLRDVALLSLDLGLLQAGAGVKGEFEQRLKGVIDAVKKSPAADHFIYRRSPHADRRGRCRGGQ
ncbi:T6SS protein Cts2V [Citrobacter freundii]|nr:T6SS protein Cts2V [Citrobacter freundii]